MQFKKREKHPWRSTAFSKVSGNMKHKSKRNYYPYVLLKYKFNIKTSQIVKGIIRKFAQSSLQSKIMKHKNNIYNKITIANEYNKCFANVGPTSAAKIPPVTKSFESYIKVVRKFRPVE